MSPAQPFGRDNNAPLPIPKDTQKEPAWLLPYLVFIYLASIVVNLLSGLSFFGVLDTILLFVMNGFFAIILLGTPVMAIYSLRRNGLVDVFDKQLILLSSAGAGIFFMVVIIASAFKYEQSWLWVIQMLAAPLLAPALVL